MAFDPAGKSFWEIVEENARTGSMVLPDGQGRSQQWDQYLLTDRDRNKAAAAPSGSAPAPASPAPPSPVPAAPEPAGGGGQMQSLAAASGAGYQEGTPGALNPKLGSRLQSSALEALAQMAGRNY